MPLSHQGAASRVGASQSAALSLTGGVSKPGRPTRRPALDDLTNGVPRRGAPSALPSIKDTWKKREAAPPQGPGTARARPDGNSRSRVADKAAANAARRAGTSGSRIQPGSMHFAPRPAPSGLPRLTQRDASNKDHDEQLEKAKLEAEELRKKAEVNESMAKNVEMLKQHFLEAKAAGSSHVDVLSAKLAEKEMRIATLESELTAKRTELNDLQVTVAKEEYARGVAQSEFDAKLVIASEKSSSLEQQLKVLQTTIAALEADKTFMDQVIKDKTSELEKSKASSTENDEVVKRLREESERVSASLARAEDSKLALEKQLDEASSRAREQKQAICEMELTSMQFKTDLRRLENEKVDLTNELTTLKSTLALERKQALSLREEIHRIREESKENARHLEEELDNLRKHKASYQDKMDSKVKELEDAKDNALTSQRNTRIELEGAKSDAAQFRATIASQEGALTSMKSQLAAVEIKLSAKDALCAEKSSEIADLKNTIEFLTSEIAKLEEQALADENERRRLHNALQELKGNIRVFCRVRPLLPSDSCDPDASVFTYHNRQQGITTNLPSGEPGKHASKNFNFDKVFGPASSQEDVFSEISQLVQSALDGYRVCIFAYGQTGSGKTHTMMGDAQNAGMIPRSIEQVFARAERMKQDQWTFELRACFLEIYNEKVRDLLCSTQKTSRQGAAASAAGPNGTRGKREEYDIVYNRNLNECSVEGLTVCDITDPKSARNLVATATKHRATAATLSNAESSRSHSVFRLYISGHNSSSGQTLRGVLNLVDLAGSERVKMSGAEGDRLKETKAINKSLTQLSIVIQSLANKEAHTPFRSSKLTRLLQDSLGGDSKCLMFVNVSPTPGSYNESLCSLRFAEQVNACDIGTAKRSTKISLVAESTS